MPTASLKPADYAAAGGGDQEEWVGEKGWPYHFGLTVERFKHMKMIEL